MWPSGLRQNPHAIGACAHSILGLSLAGMSGKREIGAAGAWADLMTAVGFLTRLPVPFGHTRLAEAVWAFPVAGAIVGGLAGAVLWGALALDLPAWTAALLAVLAATALTGALHEDGLADCADGFWGGHDPARRLAIMRDSRIGSYGVLALIGSVGLRVSLLAPLAAFWGAQPVWMMLIAVHALSRAPLPAAMAALRPASPTGLAAMAGRPGGFGVLFAAVLAILFAALALNVTPVWMPLLLLAGAAAAAALTGLLARAKIGGLTGDVLGAMEQTAQTACLALLAIVAGTG
jgi:adenosylcobinamide-GDP ribazoletransferase